MNTTLLQFGSRSRLSAPRSQKRGFTLIELMVALTGGLFFSIFVFMLARDATRFYQNESRVSDATFGAVAGFQRLRTDIARAGYLSTPNIQSPNATFCGNRSATGSLGALRALASVQIAVGGSPSNATSTLNGLTPDSINLMGSYASPDQYPIRLIQQTGGGTFEVHFQPDSPAMKRLGFDTTPANLDALFLAGRVLRIMDATGREQYGVVSSVSSATTTDPFVVLATAPNIQWKDGNNDCGLRGTEFGRLVNVVQMIRYQVRSLSTEKQFAPLYPTQALAPGEAGRTELVREEMSLLAPTTTLANTSPELVSEFAVDLKFDLTVANATNATNSASAGLGIASYAGDASDPATSQGPQWIRAVRTRLSVRSRSPDRGAQDIPLTVATGARYRVNVGTDTAPQFARVRTLQADIALRNQPTAR